MSKVIVVGGGIVGLSVAYELQKRRGDVIVLDPDTPRTGASYGNAGHIAIEQVEPLASWGLIRSAYRRWFARGGALSFPVSGFTAWLPFGLRLMAAAAPARFNRGKAALSALMQEAMPAWRRLVADLGAPDLIRDDGHYVVWESESSAQAGLAAWLDTDTGTARFHSLTGGEMAAVSALTGKKIYGGVRFENTGQVVDNRRLLERLEAAFVEAGGQVVRQKAVALTLRDGQAQVQTDDGVMRAAETVIVCAGARSKPLMEGIGYKVPMIAERGYHIQSAQHGWPEGMPPVVFEDRSMIVTGFEGGLRAGSFVELNQPDAAPDARKWRRLKAHVADLGLPMQGEPAQWMGIRPTLPDYLPAIGRSDKASNLYYAFGHQHLGLTLGPVTGEIVADMVDSGTGPQAFDIKRFG
ncbi:FAD-binding oxidoreductase [Asticcacaulis sp. AND118]|uniref:NAD(P)/FAD-dependent oxidoreductase n=1 Tax=Asticcacaulis sp. AND118 TaxID=2840468 RepID=UPI001CFF94E6|nr:FAD-dependent oxidoreductase [Asticcacaulis sp. AND118]UDF05523.1 FAD-binding oxidoreductase [Asticcacaulis sp. AND118]